jgi:hypothetical protein
VGDIHAGCFIVVGDVVSPLFTVFRPIQLDGDQGIGVIVGIVLYGDGIDRQSPTLPGGRFVGGIAGRLEAETLGVPPAGFPEVRTECLGAVVVIDPRTGGLSTPELPGPQTYRGDLRSPAGPKQ